MALLLQATAVPLCPSSAAFFGFMGVTSALVFANLGASYGTAKSSVGIVSMGIMHPTEVRWDARAPLCSRGASALCSRRPLPSPLPPPTGHAPRAGHEEHRARDHGRHSGHLRADRCGHPGGQE